MYYIMIYIVKINGNHSFQKLQKTIIFEIPNSTFILKQIFVNVIKC